MSHRVLGDLQQASSVSQGLSTQHTAAPIAAQQEGEVEGPKKSHLATPKQLPSSFSHPSSSRRSKDSEGGTVVTVLMQRCTSDQ